MLDASLPAVPMCGAEQVVFRAHLHANCAGETRKGTVLRVWSTPCEAFPVGGWANVDVTGISARIRQTRGKRAVLMYHLRDRALANRALVKQDFQAFLIEKAERAETAAVRGDSKAPFSIVKELRVRKRAGFKKVILEDGSVARDTKQEQRWWLHHFAFHLGVGTAATEDSPVFMIGRADIEGSKSNVVMNALGCHKPIICFTEVDLKSTVEFSFISKRNQRPSSLIDL